MELECSVMNFVTNSVHVMFYGGRIVIQIEYFEEVSVRLYPDLDFGCYAFLCVIDDGIGMILEVLDYVFELFFTIKEIGKGIGFGFVSVYGVVYQCGGYIEIVSVLEQGIWVEVYLLIDDELKGSVVVWVEILVTILLTNFFLLVDDELGIRDFVSGCLWCEGYWVVEVADVEEAIVLIVF